jgi:hypothetical protein
MECDREGITVCQEAFAEGRPLFALHRRGMDSASRSATWSPSSGGMTAGDASTPICPVMA